MLPSPDPTPPRTRPRPLSILLVLLPLALMVVGVAIVELSMRTEPAGSANAEGTTGTRPGAPIPSPAPAASTPAAPTAGSSAQNSQAAASPRDGAPSQPSGVVPPTPWLSLPADTTLTRIAVGSCLDQAKPQPIWQAIAEATPQLMLMAGDNVYGDVRGNDITPLVDAYRRQLAHPQFAAARRTLPMLGIWDDHDYGRNDAGVELAAKTETAQLFREFWQLEPASQPAEAGVYYSRMFGPANRRVQILFLDTRTFRAPLKTKTDTFPHWGKYEPDPDPTKTMLGDAQWAWLAAELKTPAHVRILVSSIQVIADGHGFERWGNLPRERDRLLELVRSASGRTVLVSGDRHMGALYAKSFANAESIPELTTSSLNKSFGPSRDAPTPELKSPLYHPENFGLVEINWKEGTVLLRLMDIGGGTVAALSTPLWRTP